jgi:hypothetical protein
LELRKERQGRQIRAGRSLTKWPTAHRQQPTFATKSAQSRNAESQPGCPLPMAMGTSPWAFRIFEYTP